MRVSNHFNMSVNYKDVTNEHYLTDSVKNNSERVFVCFQLSSFLSEAVNSIIPDRGLAQSSEPEYGHLSGKLSIFLRGYYKRRGRSSSVRDCRRSNLHSNTSCAMYVQLHTTTSPPPSASWPRSSGALRNVRSAQFGSGL